MTSPALSEPEYRYCVRLGSVKGEGKYVRNEGCLCPACLRWVDDRDDGTWFVSKMHPKAIAREFGGRVVCRLVSPKRSTSRG